MPSPVETSPPGGRALPSLIGLVCLVILFAAVKAAAGIIVPFLLATLLAVAFQPISEWLARRGLPAVVAASFTIIGVLAVIGGASYLLYRAVSELIGSLPQYQAQLAKSQAFVANWLEQHGLKSAATSVSQTDVVASASAWLGSGLSFAGQLIETIFLVLLITTFIQLEGATYRQKLVRVFGTPRPVRTSLAALRDVQRYLRVKSVLALVGSTILGVWCWVWGVSNPLLWGVLAFVLNFIPVIGSIISSVVPIGLALVELGPGGALGVSAGYLFVNLVIDNMLEPRLMGRALGLSPLVVLLAMLVWGFVLGPVGAVLSVPLTMTVKVILERNEDLRWIALLMGPGTETTNTVVLRSNTASLPDDAKPVK